jgi:hypothetical protein
MAISLSAIGNVDSTRELAVAESLQRRYRKQRAECIPLRIVVKLE